MIYINAYNNASEGAKELKNHLGAVIIKQENSKFKGAAHKLVINWGSRRASEEVMKSTVINKPEAVAICADKLAFFRRISEYNDSDEGYVNIPPWTDSAKVAETWAIAGRVVVCRTVLNGHSGEGILLYTKEDFVAGKDVPKAPLYTRYMPKKSEFRVHVMNGEIIDIQRKARNKDVADEDVNWKIRNHGNGFIYARNEGLGDVPDLVKINALSCIKAVGLDFGAVDIIYNEGSDAAYVLEVNTAPGLAGETGNIYAEAIRRNYVV